MEVTATAKYVRIAPRKARDLARDMSGRSVSAALRLVEFSERKAAFLLGKTLKSAIANAENNHDVSAEGLYVKEALVDNGPVMRRYIAAARGSAKPILKRTSHIRIVLSDEPPAKKKGQARRRTAKKGA